MVQRQTLRGRTRVALSLLGLVMALGTGEGACEELQVPAATSDDAGLSLAQAESTQEGRKAESDTMDNVAPVVFINSTFATNEDGSLPVTFTLSEPVTGFTLEDVVVGNGTVGDLRRNGNEYEATVSLGTTGAVSLTILGGAVEDIAGNRNVEVGLVISDRKAPLPTIVARDTAHEGCPFSVTIRFSEAVTGFRLEDLRVRNGRVESLKGREADYTATITPEERGTMAVQIGAGAATDRSGNSSEAAIPDEIDVYVAPAGPPIVRTLLWVAGVLGAIVAILSVVLFKTKGRLHGALSNAPWSEPAPSRSICGSVSCGVGGDLRSVFHRV